MKKKNTNGVLRFWDYIRIAFYVKFRPDKLATIGPARGALLALPDGTTFISASPQLQEVRPLPTGGPLPMPHAMAMAVIEESAPNIGMGICTSASFELDEEFEQMQQQRDADELAVREMRFWPHGPSDAPELAKDIQNAAEALVVARDGVDHITPTEKE